MSLLRTIDMIDPLDLMTSFARDAETRINSLIPVRRPTVNAIKIPDGFQIDIAVPGYSKTDLDIEVGEKTLTVRGKRGSVASNDAYLTREHDYSEIERVISIPEQVRVDEIEAKCERGVLTITLPVSKQKPAAKKIEVS